MLDIHSGGLIDSSKIAQGLLQDKYNRIRLERAAKKGAVKVWIDNFGKEEPVKHAAEAVAQPPPVTGTNPPPATTAPPQPAGTQPPVAAGTPAPAAAAGTQAPVPVAPPPAGSCE